MDFFFPCCISTIFLKKNCSNNADFMQKYSIEEFWLILSVISLSVPSSIISLSRASAGTQHIASCTSSSHSKLIKFLPYRSCKWIRESGLGGQKLLFLSVHTLHCRCADVKATI